MGHPRRLEHHYRVRFDEADADGHLRPSGVLRYAQDMAWRHSEEAGFDRDWYDQRAMHWIVRNVSLQMPGAATQGDDLSIATDVTGFRQVWARRNTEVRRAGLDTEPLAIVATDWVLISDDGRPTRVPAEVASLFSSGNTFSRLRIVLPEPAGSRTTMSTRVRPIDLDPLGHMNNAAYLDYVDDGLARMPDLTQRGRPGRYEVGYVRPALPGSAIEVACWLAATGSVACLISDGDGNELTRVLVSWPKA